MATIPRGGLERGAARVWDVLDFYVCKGKSLSLKIGHLSGQGHSPLGLSDLGPILLFFLALDSHTSLSAESDRTDTNTKLTSASLRV